MVGSYFRVAVLGTILWVAVLRPQAIVAEEPARPFLDALREAQYYDEALQYLEAARQDPLVPDTFRQTIDYERGVTLVESAGMIRNREAREQQLNEAQASLEKFIAENGQHPLVPAARRQFGNLSVQRARLKVEQSKQAPMAGLAEQARKHYQEAYDVFVATRDELRTRLESMKKNYDPSVERAEIEIRDKFREEYLDAQLLAAIVLEEMADTETEGSEAYRQQLTRAAEEYGQIYDKYRRFLAGHYARMYQGRCNQKIDNYDEALTYYVNDLMVQPDDPPPYRLLKTRTYLLALDCWQAQNKFEEAIVRTDEWLAKQRANEMQDLEWLTLRLQMARMHTAYAEHLESTKPKDPQIKTSYTEARKLARSVSRIPSELQEDARRLMADLPGGAESVAANDGDPETFDEAKDAGREALGAMQGSELVIAEFPERIKAETDAATRSELEQNLKNAETQIVEQRREALRLFLMALEMAEPETDLEQLNLVRYFVSYLYFQEGEFYDAFVISNFVARRFPGSPAAQQCARVTLAAALQLYGLNTAEEKPYEAALVVDTAEYIAATWAGKPEALDALSTLIPFEIQRGNLAQAESLVKQLPEGSPGRVVGQLKVGQAYWSQCLTLMAEIARLRDGANDGGLSTDSSQVDQLSEQLQQQTALAHQLLAGAVTQLDDVPMDRVVASAILALVQLEVETGQAEEAIAHLEDARFGLLTMISRGDPAVDYPPLVEESYKQALRAYIGALQTAADQQHSERLIGKAKDTMERMKQQLDTSDGKLIAIYYGMARDLQQQLRSATDPGKKALLANGFDAFLTEVTRESTEFNVLNWAAESYFALAAGWDREGDTASDTAKTYFGKSAQVFQNILAKAKADEGFLLPQYRPQIMLRLAMAQRNRGQFEEAIEIFREVLEQDNAKLNVQVEAARTYQLWATQPGEDEHYDTAIKGAFPDKETGRNVIWGWITLAKITIRYDQFRDTFHEARYNLAVCHYRSAMRKRNTADRNKYLNYAKNDILQTHQLYPELGGVEQRQKYDELLRQIQKELKETPAGLPQLSASGTR